MNGDYLKYHIDYQEGLFICEHCQLGFPISYKKKRIGRNMSMTYAAKANFIKHQKACYKKIHNIIEIRCPTCNRLVRHIEGREYYCKKCGQLKNIEGKLC
jgi:hypothetical protein